MIKFFLYLAIAFSPCWAADSGSSHAFVGSVALAMVLAGFCGLLCKLLHQPPLVGYLLAGMLLGPVGLAWIEDPSQIEAMSELGLILLLFMIGLEIDLKKMFAMGKLVWLPGLLQFPLTVCFLLCLLYFFPEFAPASWGGKLLLSGAFSLSSTLIVVKLLYQKRDLNAISGRMAVGILVFQDIWAILALAGQQQGEFSVTPILITVSKSILLILAAMIVSKYILPRLFEVLAKTPELVLIMSLSWCFLVSLLADFIGLSMEMGALMAGVAIATYPYSNYVITRITSIRDFFITLFFVGLGLQIPALDGELLQQVLFFTAVVLIARYLIFFSLLYPLKVGHRLSIVTPINLGQISEFSLILLTLGVAAGQIEQQFLNIGMWVFVFLGVLTSYAIPNAHKIQTFLSRALLKLGLADLASKLHPELRVTNHPIVVLGYFSIAEAFIKDITESKDILPSDVLVVDFNPITKIKLELLKVRALYGDLSFPDTLRNARLDQAQAVICTIPDSHLRGTSNLKLLRVLQRTAPDATHIMTAENSVMAKILYSSGADFVIQPNLLAGHDLVPTVISTLAGKIEDRAEEDLEKLDEPHLSSGNV